MSYSNDLQDMLRHEQAAKLQRLFRARSPGSYRLSKQSQYTLVINMKTARKLGIDPRRRHC